jgi:hypothetical protein
VIPEKTTSITDLAKQRAMLTDKAQGVTRQMIPFAPMLAEIVQTGRANSEQEQVLAGLAIEFALNVLRLAMLVGSMDAIELVTSSVGLEITPSESGDEHGPV